MAKIKQPFKKDILCVAQDMYSTMTNWFIQIKGDSISLVSSYSQPNIAKSNRYFLIASKIPFN